MPNHYRTHQVSQRMSDQDEVLQWDVVPIEFLSPILSGFRRTAGKHKYRKLLHLSWKDFGIILLFKLVLTIQVSAIPEGYGVLHLLCSVQFYFQ